MTAGARTATRDRRPGSSRGSARPPAYRAQRDAHASRKQRSGFTLLEVMVALVIVAAGASIVLTHMRTLMDLKQRSRLNQNQVLQILNEAALLPTLDVAQLRVRVRSDHLELYAQRSPEDRLEVRNFTLPQEEAIPVDQAYTAFQSYRIAPQQRYSLSLLNWSLPPPEP